MLKAKPKTIFFLIFLLLNAPLLQAQKKSNATPARNAIHLSPQEQTSTDSLAEIQQKKSQELENAKNTPPSGTAAPASPAGATAPAAPPNEFPLMDEFSKNFEKVPVGGYQSEKKPKVQETPDAPQDYWSYRKKEWARAKAEEEKRKPKDIENYQSPPF